MMKYLQKLGKALFLPVAVLPICGILKGLGYAMAPAAMGVPDKPEGGLLYVLGFFLIQAGGAIIDNMPLLFAVGVSFGLADDGDGTAACCRPCILADGHKPTKPQGGDCCCARYDA